MPTQLAELNAVLADLVATQQRILGGDYVGTYLVGSFAVGDPDEHSDCDLITAVRARPTPAQIACLRAVHDELPTRDGFWCRHLEGSYAPVGELRTLDGLGRPWLYNDHGSRVLEWSTHCNSVEQRWALRERGIALSGPPPASFAAEVPAQVVRSAMARELPRFMDNLATWADIQAVAWSQRYAVTSLSRMYWSYLDGQIHSKAASLDWAMTHFPAEWTPLLAQVKSGRQRGLDRDDRPDPDSVRRTWAFAADVSSRVADAAELSEG